MGGGGGWSMCVCVCVCACACVCVCVCVCDWFVVIVSLLLSRVHECHDYLIKRKHLLSAYGDYIYPDPRLALCIVNLG